MRIASRDRRTPRYPYSSSVCRRTALLRCPAMSACRLVELQFSVPGCSRRCIRVSQPHLDGIDNSITAWISDSHGTSLRANFPWIRQGHGAFKFCRAFGEINRYDSRRTPHPTQIVTECLNAFEMLNQHCRQRRGRTKQAAINNDDVNLLGTDTR